MNKHHRVEEVRIEKGILSLVVDGNSIQRDLRDVSTLLAEAEEDAQNEYEVSPAGYGIHWPLIDEDVSIDGLLGIEHSPSSSRKSA